MRLLSGYGLIAFATGIGVAGIAGRWLHIEWLGQWHHDDPGMALSTAFAVISLGCGVFLLHNSWRKSDKNKTETQHEAKS